MSEKISIVISNSKGGVGKSFLSIMLAEYYSNQKSKKVLLVDLDHQQLNTCEYVADPETLFAPSQMKLKTILGFIKDNYSTLMRKSDPEIYQELKSQFMSSLISNGRNISVTASDPNINDIDYELMQSSAKDDALKILKEIAFEMFDVVIFDCTPDIGKAVVKSAYGAAGNLIIPTTADEFGMRGIVRAHTMYDDYTVKINPDFNFAGIVINKLHNRSSDEAYAEYIKEQFGSHVFNTEIKDYANYMDAINAREFILSAKGVEKKDRELMKSFFAEIDERIKPDRS